MVLIQSNPQTERIIPDHPPGPPESLRTIYDVARWRAEQTSDEVVFIFLDDGEREGATLTYGQLDERARAVAAQLQKRGATGERVLLLCQPGYDFVVGCYGCFYAGAVPVPAYPPDPMRLQRTIPRLRAVVNDAGAKFVLGSTDTIKLMPQALGNAEYTLALSDLTDAEIANWQPHPWREQDVAVLQYTSGSTGEPRGVMVTHANFMSCLLSMQHEDSPDVVGMTWLPPYHDMGLVGGILLPIFSGRPVVIMSPVAFLESPVRWLRAISHYRVKTSIGPNFSYDLCTRKIRPEDCEGLDLSCWTIAVVGAEPVRPSTLERFSKMFAPYGFSRDAFMPAYGLAEAVLNVTADHRWEPLTITQFSHKALEENRVERVDSSHPDARPLVACGKAWPGYRVIIVDPQTRRPLEPERVGEIWIQSPTVTAGYWKRPEETERIFNARLDNGDGPFLRSGDLGFYSAGQLYVTGRLKEVIILGGRNFYPQDIERVVANSHPTLRPDTGAAFSCELDGEERLVVVQEAKRSDRYDLGDIIADIRRELAEEFTISPYVVVLIAGGSLPKTSSHKIQRRECREMFLKGELKVIKEWRARAVLDDLAGMLRAYIEGKYAGPIRPTTMLFADLGMGSIDAVMFAERIEEHFKEDFPFNAFLAELQSRGLNDISVGDLARFLQRNLPG